MNPTIATNLLWEAINTLDGRVETGYDAQRVNNARMALNYLENWCIPSHDE